MDGLQGLASYPLPRRGVIMTGLISGFTLATTRVDAQAIHTDPTGLAAGETTIPTSQGALPAYFARPDGAGPFPTVLVIEEIFGVHEYIKDTCRRLAKAGYLAVAPELYARIGDLSKMADINAIIRDVISKTPDDQLLLDLDATATWAAVNHGDPKRLAVTGFCRGGRDTWLYAAHNPALKAAVAWYGPVGGTSTAIQPHNAADVATELKAPLLGLYGGQDAGIPVADVQAAAAKATGAGRVVRSMCSTTLHMAFTRTTGQATANPTPRRVGRRCCSGSPGIWPDRHGDRPRGSGQVQPAKLARIASNAAGVASAFGPPA